MQIENNYYMPRSYGTIFSFDYPITIGLKPNATIF